MAQSRPASGRTQVWPGAKATPHEPDAASSEVAQSWEPKQAAMVRGHCELDELYNAAQRAAKHLGPALFHDAMREMFRIGRPGDVDLSLPQAIWTLQPRLVVTTNFDSVLQWACPAATLVLNNQPAELADVFTRPNEAEPWIWHLHGHIDRADTLILAPVETFLKRWCEAVYVESPKAAQEHCGELLSAVRGKVEIRRMARNPVMLTALAVVHWNERRLPEQRADLYNSIITWLSRARQQREGRLTADGTVVLLQELALAMQDPTSPKPEAPASGPHKPEAPASGSESSPRLIQVPKRWAAEHIALEFAAGAPVTRDTVAAAERFLEEEEVDSGIVVGRGNEVAFWHLTFQEFLAARAIASRLEPEQQQILFADAGKLYRADWREVVTLLSGTLHQQGRAKVDGFIGRLFAGLGAAATLADRARCAGLIGLVLRDLEPLNYQVSDARYPALLEAVTAIFDPARSASVPLDQRIAAADALGQAGDLRLDPRRLLGDGPRRKVPDGGAGEGCRRT